MTDAPARTSGRLALVVVLSIAIVMAGVFGIRALVNDSSASDPAPTTVRSPGATETTTSATSPRVQSSAATETTTSASVCPTVAETSSADTDFLAITPDTSGCVDLPNLGIRLEIPPELREQGLLARSGPNPMPAMPSEQASVYFTTAFLNETWPTCDGLNHWLGIMTRYEGSSAEMGEHAHGSFAVDFPGFHISFMGPEDSCVTFTPNYHTIGENGMGAETIAARQLYDAMLAAQPL